MPTSTYLSDDNLQHQQAQSTDADPLQEAEVASRLCRRQRRTAPCRQDTTIVNVPNCFVGGGALL